jgi:hypothetical protein
MADDVPRDRRGRVRLGRNETAVDLDLRRAPELARSVRSSLRTLARALDRAEVDGDADAVSRLAHEFHDQLAACGIAVPATRTADSWDVLLAELARPGSGASDRPDA